MSTARKLIVLLGFLSFCLLILQCGKDSKKDDETSQPPLYNGKNLPDTWDGTTDWSDSTWEVN